MISSPDGKQAKCITQGDTLVPLALGMTHNVRVVPNTQQCVRGTPAGESPTRPCRPDPAKRGERISFLL